MHKFISKFKAESVNKMLSTIKSRSILQF